MEVYRMSREQVHVTCLNVSNTYGYYYDYYYICYVHPFLCGYSKYYVSSFDVFGCHFIAKHILKAVWIIFYLSE